jgi:hypothetical protein
VSDNGGGMKMGGTSTEYGVIQYDVIEAIDTGWYSY